MARLSFPATDWKLPIGSTPGKKWTRNGGLGQPKLNWREAKATELEDSEWSWDTDIPSSEEEDLDLSKPSSTRVVIENDALKVTMEKHCRCLQCHGVVDVSTKTVCLATSLIIRCKDPQCGYIYYSNSPAQVDIEANRRERSTDHAIIILCVLGLFHVATVAPKLQDYLGCWVYQMIQQWSHSPLAL